MHGGMHVMYKLHIASLSVLILANREGSLTNHIEWILWKRIHIYIHKTPYLPTLGYTKSCKLFSFWQSFETLSVGDIITPPWIYFLKFTFEVS